MAKNLVVFGASFAAGYRKDYNPHQDIDKEDKQNSWPAYLASKLGLTVENHARSGSTNSRVFRKAFDSMLNPTDGVYIVELGPYDWYEVASSVTGKIEQIQPSRNTTLLNKLMLLEYCNPYFSYTTLLRQIISLQALAKVNQVKLYFLDTSARLVRDLNYNNFVQLIIQANSALFDALDDDMINERFMITKNLNDNVDYSKFLLTTTVYDFLLQHDKKLLDSTNHPTIAGQKLIADILYEDIARLEDLNRR